MTKKKLQTIYVVLHEGPVKRVQIPVTHEERDIQFLLNSRFGEQGWQSYKIRETNKQNYEKDSSRMGKVEGNK